MSGTEDDASFTDDDIAPKGDIDELRRVAKRKLGLWLWSRSVVLIRGGNGMGGGAQALSCSAQRPSINLCCPPLPPPHPSS